MPLSDSTIRFMASKVIHPIRVEIIKWVGKRILNISHVLSILQRVRGHRIFVHHFRLFTGNRMGALVAAPNTMRYRILLLISLHDMLVTSL